MKTWQMLLLRFWSISLGSIPWCSYLLKRFLIMLMIKRAKRKYVAATDYFDIKSILHTK